MELVAGAPLIPDLQSLICGYVPACEWMETVLRSNYLPTEETSHRWIQTLRLLFTNDIIDPSGVFKLAQECPQPPDWWITINWTTYRTAFDFHYSDEVFMLSARFFGLDRDIAIYNGHEVTGQIVDIGGGNGTLLVQIPGTIRYMNRSVSRCPSDFEVSSFSTIMINIANRSMFAKSLLHDPESSLPSSSTIVFLAMIEWLLSQ